MCGGGVGSANDPGNDKESGSGNSFKETMANIFSPGDGMSYVDGQLTDSGRNTYKSTAAYKNDRGDQVTPKTSTIYGQDGSPMQVRSDANDMYKSRIAPALVGAATGGIPGLVSNLAMNELTGGKGILGALRGGSDIGGGLKNLFQAREPGSPEGAYDERDMRLARQVEINRSLSSGSARNPPIAAAPTVTVSDGMTPQSAMSTAAGEGAFRPIRNPDYDPNDPMSQQFVSNPSYAQLLEYRDNPQVLAMAEGGELSAPEGGNEKTMISDAVRAVKGEMSEEQSAAVLGQFLASYGEEALRDLVDKVQSGEFDDTVTRFANGEAGEVRGPGDGSGVDDKVPASLEGQQDVLLADGEFVLRKKTADALEKKYGGGFLNAVNKAESAAPKTMQQYMASN